MSRKKKKRSRPVLRAANLARLPTDGESRQSVAVTVAWMLSLFVTLAAEAIAVPATIISKSQPQAQGEGITITHIAVVFLFLSFVTGLVSVGLVPLVYRVRAIPPPQAIVIAALVAGAVPPITMVLRWLL